MATAKPRFAWSVSDSWTKTLKSSLRLRLSVSAVTKSLRLTPLARMARMAFMALMALNLNTATIQELDALPGIGPVLAERIIEFREKRGGFRRVEELLAVPGISERKWQTLRTLVEVGTVEVGTRRGDPSSSGARSERNGG